MFDGIWDDGVCADKSCSEERIGAVERGDGAGSATFVFRCGGFAAVRVAFFIRTRMTSCCASMVRSCSTASKVKSPQQMINNVENSPARNRRPLGPTAAPILRVIKFSLIREPAAEHIDKADPPPITGNSAKI
jgi:hypothetical protein